MKDLREVSFMSEQVEFRCAKFATQLSLQNRVQLEERNLFVKEMIYSFDSNKR
jgi:hypothetical protein